MITLSTATRRRNGAANPGFMAHLRQQSDNRQVVVALLGELLRDQAQPLTVAEVRELAVQAGLNTGYRVFDQNLVRQFLTQLVGEGKLHTRVETDAERALRARGQKAASRNAALFSVVPGVPARTEAVAVPGAELRTVSDYAKPGPKAKRRGRPKGSLNRPKPAVAPAAPVTRAALAVESLVEELVAERTADLAARLDAAERRADLAEQRLADIRRAITGS